MSKNLSAVIVAARSGRRLRTPIPMLPFGDTTVLGRTLRAYLDAGFGEVIVVLGYRGEEVRASLGELAGKVSTVQAPVGDEPYADLLRIGVERLSGSASMFAIGRGDQPFLGKEIMDELVAASRATKAKILVPTWQGALGHPVFFDAAFVPEFKSLVAPAETWDILKTHADQVEDLEVRYNSIIRGIEDHDDYVAALRFAGLPVPEPAPRPEPAPVSGNGGGFVDNGSGTMSFGG